MVEDVQELTTRVKASVDAKARVSYAYLGNVVDVWEKFDAEGLFVDIGSDQTSLHNPWAGGYYPVGRTFKEANDMMVEDPDAVQTHVKASLRRHAEAVNKHTARGTYFFDYGNAFLLEASRSGADVMNEEATGSSTPVRARHHGTHVL